MFSNIFLKQPLKTLFFKIINSVDPCLLEKKSSKNVKFFLLITLSSELLQKPFFFRVTFPFNNFETVSQQLYQTIGLKLSKKKLLLSVYIAEKKKERKSEITNERKKDREKGKRERERERKKEKKRKKERRRERERERERERKKERQKQTNKKNMKQKNIKQTVVSVP